jgi:hypothetical protein
MNYDQLTANFIAIIQAVSLNKELVGASMTLREIGEDHLDDLDFAFAAICFESENRVVFSMPETLSDPALADETLGELVRMRTSATDPRLNDPLFVTKKIVAIKDAIIAGILTHRDEPEEQEPNSDDE